MPRLPTMRVIGSQVILRTFVSDDDIGNSHVEPFSDFPSVCLAPGERSTKDLNPLFSCVKGDLCILPQLANRSAIGPDRFGRQLGSWRFIQKGGLHEFIGEPWH